jgi:hypothetical protein
MGSAASAGRAKDWSRRASGEDFSRVGFLFANRGGSARLWPDSRAFAFILFYRIFVLNTDTRA